VKTFQTMGSGAKDVTEYWIVDPGLDAIEIHRRVDGTLARVAELGAEAGDTLTTPLLPAVLYRLPPCSPRRPGTLDSPL
jgi:hypothetical protein